MERHKAAVTAISARVRHFHTHSLPFRIHHGSTNSTRPHFLPRSAMVDTSSLKHILKISPSTRTALVEPNVPMDALVAATVAHGLVPPMVMEFPGITVGGGFSGTSGESSSFKHGFFDACVGWIEIVLANGDVVRASANENADLFEGARGGFGTLGVITLLEVRLVDVVGGFVEVSYRGVRSVGEMVRRLEEVMGEEGVDYVDGIMFEVAKGTLVVGKRVRGAPSHEKKVRGIQTFHRPQDPWFYLHAQQLTSSVVCSPLSPSSSPNTITELVPITDYLFRYDRGAFWTGVHAFTYFLVPFTSFFRRLLDPFMHTRVMYHALHASGHMDRYILQDCVLPASNAEEFVDWVGTELKIWPLWLCPLRKREGDSRNYHPWPRTQGKEDWALNIGVWGPGPPGKDEFLRVNVDLEKKLGELGGMKWLYAQVFCSKDEFWAQYDREGYEALRKKWHASGLPSVWEKVKRKDEGGRESNGLKGFLWTVWPVSGLYGVWKAWGGGEYLVTKEGNWKWGWMVALFLSLLLGIIAIL